jgi:hypothetical protein
MAVSPQINPTYTGMSVTTATKRKDTYFVLGKSVAKTFVKSEVFKGSET